MNKKRVDLSNTKKEEIEVSVEQSIQNLIYAKIVSSSSADLTFLRKTQTEGGEGRGSHSSTPKIDQNLSEASNTLQTPKKGIKGAAKEKEAGDGASNQIVDNKLTSDSSENEEESEGDDDDVADIDDLVDPDGKVTMDSAEKMYSDIKDKENTSRSQKEEEKDRGKSTPSSARKSEKKKTHKERKSLEEKEVDLLYKKIQLTESKP